MAKTKKMALGGMGAAMGVRPQDTALGQAAATKLGQAAATKLGQIRGRSNMPPSPSPAVKSPFVPPQTQRPAVQTPQQRAAGMASMGVKPLTPPPSGPVAPRGFGPPPGPNASAKIAGLKSLLDGKPVSGLQPQAQQKPGMPDYAQPYVQNYQALQSRQAQQTALPPTAGLKGTRVSADQTPSPMKKGGMVSSKPKASSASSRGDGIATKGKTKGRFV